MEESSEVLKAALDHFLADNPELEELSARLATFNIFRTLKIEGDEIRHSNILAWLLDPDESHGLDDIFLRRLLSNIILEGEGGTRPISAAKIELLELSDIEVRREWNHIDLLVIDHENQMVLLIENKIHSGEGADQLARYKKVFENDSELQSFKPIYVFLTLTGQASEDEEAGEYISYSWKEVFAVLERIVKQRESQLTESVKIFLTHYLETLKELTMQDEDLIKLCKDIYRKHKEAIEAIFEHGMTSNFQQEVEKALKGGEFEIINSNPGGVTFLPASWKRVLPEPVNIYCSFWPDPSYRDFQKIYLGFNIQVKDQEVRDRCIEKLVATDLRLIKKGQKSHNLDKTEISDPTDEKKIQEAVAKLLQKWKKEFDAAEEVFKKVFKKEG